MLQVTRDLIDYYGISDVVSSNFNNYKQFNINEELYLDNGKPNISEIVKVYSDVTIEKTKVVKTPKGISLEGSILSGHKLFVYGSLHHKIQYLSKDVQNVICVDNFTIPFVTNINLPVKFHNNSYITCSAYIDDIYVTKLDDRCIYNNTSLLITVEM